MDDSCCTMIPTAVRRRLLLNLCGFRLRAGVWHAPHGTHGTQTRSEEQVDLMSDLQFAVLIGGYLSAGSAVGTVSAMN
jgi:hypothetical protein